jgi:hypothetical protein
MLDHIRNYRRRATARRTTEPKGEGHGDPPARDRDHPSRGRPDPHLGCRGVVRGPRTIRAPYHQATTEQTLCYIGETLVGIREAVGTFYTPRPRTPRVVQASVYWGLCAKGKSPRRGQLAHHSS